MAKYLFVYRDGEGKSDADLSPDEMQKHMEAWMTWIQGGFEAGWMVNAGDALKPEGRVVHPDESVTDGPFAESKELVGGYSIIEAPSYDDACTHAKQCPCLHTGGSVEVRELANLAPPE